MKCCPLYSKIAILTAYLLLINDESFIYHLETDVFMSQKLAERLTISKPAAVKTGVGEANRIIDDLFKRDFATRHIPDLVKQALNGSGFVTKFRPNNCLDMMLSLPDIKTYELEGSKTLVMIYTTPEYICISSQGSKEYLFSGLALRFDDSSKKETVLNYVLQTYQNRGGLKLREDLDYHNAKAKGIFSGLSMTTRSIHRHNPQL